MVRDGALDALVERIRYDVEGRGEWAQALAEHLRRAASSGALDDARQSLSEHRSDILRVLRTASHDRVRGQAAHCIGYLRPPAAEFFDTLLSVFEMVLDSGRGGLAEMLDLMSAYPDASPRALPLLEQTLRERPYLFSQVAKVIRPMGPDAASLLPALERCRPFLSTIVQDKLDETVGLLTGVSDGFDALEGDPTLLSLVRRMAGLGANEGGLLEEKSGRDAAWDEVRALADPALVPKAVEVARQRVPSRYFWAVTQVVCWLYKATGASELREIVSGWAQDSPGPRELYWVVRACEDVELPERHELYRRLLAHASLEAHVQYTVVEALLKGGRAEDFERVRRMSADEPGLHSYLIRMARLQDATVATPYLLGLVLSARPIENSQTRRHRKDALRELGVVAEARGTELVRASMKDRGDESHPGFLHAMAAFGDQRAAPDVVRVLWSILGRGGYQNFPDRGFGGYTGPVENALTFFSKHGLESDDGVREVVEFLAEPEIFGALHPVDQKLLRERWSVETEAEPTVTSHDAVYEDYEDGPARHGVETRFAIPSGWSVPTATGGRITFDSETAVFHVGLAIRIAQCDELDGGDLLRCTVWLHDARGMRWQGEIDFTNWALFRQVTGTELAPLRNLRGSEAATWREAFQNALMLINAHDSIDVREHFTLLIDGVPYVTSGKYVHLHYDFAYAAREKAIVARLRNLRSLSGERECFAPLAHVLDVRRLVDEAVEGRHLLPERVRSRYELPRKLRLFAVGEGYYPNARVQFRR